MILNPQSKLFWHGDRVKLWLEGGMPYPVLVEIAPAGFCNASCPWCFFHNRRSDESIDKYIMIRTLEELAGMKVKAINWTGGGEPTLHPDFNTFVIIADELGLEQGLFTNGYLEIQNPEMFKWIRISLTDRGFDPIKIPTGYFGICMNMLADTTREELEGLCVQARDVGAAYFQVRPALVGHYKDQPLLSPPWYLEEYTTDDFQVLLTPYKFQEAIRPHGYSECYGYHFCPSINWKGHVGVCLYRMGDRKYVLGDLKSKSFMEIWRQKRITECMVDDKCQNCCKNHEINKVLFTAKHMEHVNFL